MQNVFLFQFFLLQSCHHLPAEAWGGNVYADRVWHIFCLQLTQHKRIFLGFQGTGRDRNGL